jgi:hypothetical protein
MLSCQHSRAWSRLFVPRQRMIGCGYRGAQGRRQDQKTPVEQALMRRRCKVGRSTRTRPRIIDAPMGPPASWERRYEIAARVDGAGLG